jgi:hypothetical protein
MSRRALWFLVTLACIGGFPQPSSAQKGAQNAQGAEAALREAQQLSQQGQFARAVELLENVLTQSGTTLAQGSRDQLQQALAGYQARIATYAVTLAPASAVIKVDGQPATLRHDNVLRLDPGSHEVLATADGYRELRQTLHVRGGEREELRLLLAPVGGNPETARNHFKRGEVAYAQGDYELAIREWRTAFAIDPRPLIQFALAQAFERLGKLTDAVDALKQYLQTADPNDINQADARARLAALEARLQRTGVTISGGVEGAMILVDGQEWGRLPRPDRIALAPGHHRIVIRMQGYQDYVSNIVVPPGQVVEIAVEMEKEGATADAPSSGENGASGGATLQASTADAGASGTPWFIASGVLGAGTVGSLIYFLERNGVVSDCEQDAVFCRHQSAVERERTLGLITTGVLGIGAIGALVIGFVVQGKANRERAAALPCMPSIGALHCQASF